MKEIGRIKFRKEIDFPRIVKFQGRNGVFNAKGLAINVFYFPDKKDISIRPITTKEMLAQCRIELPAESLYPLIDLLQDVAREIDPIVEHWGDDPVFAVENWRYEVENDDTRLGYVDWVRNQRELKELEGEPE